MDSKFIWSGISDDTLRRLTDGQLFAADDLDTTTCRQCGGTWIHVGDFVGLLLQMRDAAINEAKQDVYTGLTEVLSTIKHAQRGGEPPQEGE